MIFKLTYCPTISLIVTVMDNLAFFVDVNSVAMLPLRFWCVCKKLAVLACLTMLKVKLNQNVPNKSADLLKKIGLMGTVQCRYSYADYCSCFFH